MDPETKEPQYFTDKFSEESQDRHRVGRASHALILKAAKALPAADRALLNAVFADGRSTAEVARLRDTSPRNLAYHVQRLSKRVLSPRYKFVVAKRHLWTRSRATIASCCFIRGRTLRDAARIARLSFHAARHHYDAVLALYDASIPRAKQAAKRGNKPSAQPSVQQGVKRGAA